MKLNDLSKKQEITSKLNGKSFESEISDPKVMMLIVRDKLYAHKLRTPIQEYISNAVDSQVVAKTQDIPMRIVLPTALEPVLKIRDYGTGMSEEKVRKTFSQYTASDKRENLELIGGFGLGSKSAFAYTDKFTVVSYFNGVKHSYVAYAPSQLDLVFTPLSTHPSEEKNGVEIQIPIKPTDILQTIEAVTRMVILLPVCPEVINYPNGNFKQKVYDTFYKAMISETNSFCAFDRSLLSADTLEALNVNRNQYFIRYNNIPYIIPSQHDHVFRPMEDKLRSKLIVMFKAAPNTFQIPPSRELLVEDDKYKSFIADKAKEVAEWNQACRAIEKERLDQVTELKEMESVTANLRFNFEDFNKDLEFQGQMLPCKITTPNNVTFKIRHDLMEITRHKSRFGGRFSGGSFKTNKFSVRTHKYIPASEKYSESCVSFYPSKAKLLMTCNDELDKISLVNVNKLRDYFKLNMEVDSILLIKPDSPFAGIATNTVEKLEVSPGTRQIPLYYTMYDDGHNKKLIMGQTHFAGQMQYNYIELTTDPKDFVIETWIYRELTKNGARLVILPPETVKKIEKRKGFKKVDLSEIKNQDPRANLSEKQIEFITQMKYFMDKNYSQDDRFFWHLVSHIEATSTPVKNKWLRKLVSDLTKFKDLETKYKLSLLPSPDYTYSSKEASITYEKEKSAYLNSYPLFQILKSEATSKDMAKIVDYINLVDQARKTGILKSV